MNSLDYVEAMARMHENERERDRAARYRQEHPQQDAGRDSHWADFIHRWAAHTNEPEQVQDQSLAMNMTRFR